MTDLSMINTGQLHIDINDYELEGKLIEEFENNLVNHALREKKEFYAAELVFRSFYNNIRPSENDEDYYYLNFIPLFEKVAELSSRKKISMKWVLSLNHLQEVKLTEIDPDDLNIDLINEYGRREYRKLWFERNRDLDRSLGSLQSLYIDHEDLFVDDTTYDQKDIMMILNNYGF